MVLELERKNSIYITDPEIIRQFLEDSESKISDYIFRFNFKGNNNSAVISSDVSILPNCHISFAGNDNAIYIGPHTQLTATRISFEATNSLAYICGNSNSIFPQIRLGSDLIFFWGYGCSCSNGFGAQSACHLREAKNVIFGSDCMISWNVLVRNAVGHSIYDANSKERIARGDSIIIGDHVWINMDARILNGARIQQGTVIGMGSFVSKKQIPCNCIAAGVPVKVLRENIVWSRKGPYNVTEAEISLFDTLSECSNDAGQSQIGWNNLLMIDAIDPSLSSKDKMFNIQKIIY